MYYCTHSQPLPKNLNSPELSQHPPPPPHPENFSNPPPTKFSQPPPENFSTPQKKSQLTPLNPPPPPRP